MLPLTPTKLGRYEIVDEIGKGAMGVVYLARDPLIGRLVALKTFRIGYSVKDQEMEQFRLRFMREAQSAGILTHPNIVTIHDVVESSEDGVAFIAMEYVRGTNLKLLLQGDQPLSMQFIIDTIAQVGDALDYAHSNRVIHRDVKPANILITSDNRVKITDFGIARLDSSNLTQEGQLLGTPNYMAPEQIQGKEVDHRSDLFSLGVVLYELLTRHKPFQGENLTVVSHRIVYDHFTPPREYVRDLPPGLEPILAKALEKDPARRYQRARDLVDDLRKLVEASRPSDDLNETQSLSSLAVPPPAAKGSFFGRWRREPARPVPPPPLPPPPPVQSGDASGSGSSVASASAVALQPPPPLPPPPSLSDTNATAVTEIAPPPPPARAGWSTSPGRLFLVGFMAVLLCALLGAGVLLWLTWSQPAVVERKAEEDARQAQVVELVKDANARIHFGDYSGALEDLEKAERLAPGRKGIQGLRERANEGLRSAGQLATEDQVAYQVDAAQRAIDGKRYDEAIAAATAALNLDPTSEPANALLTQAKAAQLRASRQRPPAGSRPSRPGEQIAATATPEASPGPSAAQPAPAELKAAILNVHLRSDFPDGGSLIVWVNGRELMRKNFPGSRRGFFGRKTETQELNRSYDVPATGTVPVRAHITPTGMTGRVRDLFANFPGGSSRTLDIHLSASGEPQLSLN
jgi:serine/threonine protein kinase